MNAWFLPLRDRFRLRGPRKWATERKAHAIKGGAAAGGWKDVETLLMCYQQPNDETLPEVMAEPWKLREAAV